MKIRLAPKIPFNVPSRRPPIPLQDKNQLVHQLVVPGPITSCDWTHQSQLLLVMSSGAPQEVGRMGTSGTVERVEHNLLREGK